MVKWRLAKSAINLEPGDANQARGNRPFLFFWSVRKNPIHSPYQKTAWKIYGQVGCHIPHHLTTVKDIFMAHLINGEEGSSLTCVLYSLEWTRANTSYYIYYGSHARQWSTIGAYFLTNSFHLTIRTYTYVTHFILHTQHYTTLSLPLVGYSCTCRLPLSYNVTL